MSGVPTRVGEVKDERVGAEVPDLSSRTSPSDFTITLSTAHTIPLASHTLTTLPRVLSDPAQVGKKGHWTQLQGDARSYARKIEDSVCYTGFDAPRKLQRRFLT